MPLSRVRGVVLALVAVLAAAGPLTAPASARAEGEPPAVILAPADADEAGRLKAQAELAAVQRALRNAVGAERKAVRAVAPLQRQIAESAANIERLAAADRAAAEALAAARDRVRDFAVAGYVVGGDTRPVDYLLRAEDPVDLARRHALVVRATEAKEAALNDYANARAAASAELERAMARADSAKADLAKAQNVLKVAAAEVIRLRADAEHHRQLLQVVTAAAPVGASDIPRLFLDAYRRAAAAQQRKTPGCRLSWTVVAAIGRIESNHGRYRGARLALNGDIHPRIVGIPLDGTRSRLIADTDKGELDGDTSFDRAVGPMQFIPSTWKRIAQDGNGDRALDANNAYDAALGAAAYLCRAVPQGGLDKEEALRRAVFSYNHSLAYVDLVLASTRTFDAIAPTLQ